MMPQLQSLEIGYNQLSSFTSDRALRCFPQQVSLQSLNLDSNLFSDWAHICHALKQYPRYVIDMIMSFQMYYDMSKVYSASF